jgi:cysteine desulfurase
MTDGPIYLDNNATTYPAPEAVEAVLRTFTDHWANPSSAHSLGQAARHEIEQARESVAGLLGCNPSEITFNSGATEGNSTAIFSALEALPERRHVITACTEHTSVLEVLRPLSDSGYRVTELNVDRLGRLDLDELRNEISGDTTLVSLMWANNETGVIHPVAGAGEIAKSFGAMFHVDAAQAAGKLPIRLREEQAVDYLTVSAHKFHGLKGAGALFTRQGAPYTALLRGGHHENARRAGTENLPGIVAMGAAARLALAGMARHVEHMGRMRDRLQSALLAGCEDVIVHGDPEQRLPNTLNAGFGGVDAEALLMLLDAEGVAVTAGSACRSGALEPSPVLLAMRVPVAYIHGSLRFCVSRYTSQQEVDAAAQKVIRAVKRLRELSPYGGVAPARAPEGNELAAHRAWFARA